MPHTAVFGGSKSVICASGHLRRKGVAALAAKACLTDIFRRTKRACFHNYIYLSGYRMAFGFQRCSAEKIFYPSYIILPAARFCKRGFDPGGRGNDCPTMGFVL